MVVGGYPIGVAKQAEAPIISAMTSGRGSTPSSAASASVTGVISAATALLLSSSDRISAKKSMPKTSTQRGASTRAGSTQPARKRVGEGKSVSVRVELGDRRDITTK